MDEYLEDYIQQLRAARAHQIEMYGDDVAEGKHGWYMIQVLQQELGEVSRAAISGTPEHTREAVVRDITAVQQKLANLGAAVAATWEVLERDSDAFANPEIDIYVIPWAATPPDETGPR